MKRLSFSALVMLAACLAARALAQEAAPDPAESAASEPDTKDLSPGLGPVHAIAMHGDPEFEPNFTHFGYANPDAPKGGRLVLAEVGTFDSLNPYLPLGRPMWYMAYPRRVFDSLMIRTKDEPFTLYGLLAETVEMPEDRSWIAFTLRKEAHFSDGTPVTVDDVIFSIEAQRDYGRHRGRYKQIARIDRPGPRTLRLVFKEGDADRELPLIFAMMPVFSQRYYESHDFSKTTLEPPLGNGPYVVADVDPGRSLTFRRDPDYWGKDLAVNAGFSNFDEIRYEYYRDANAAFEAFKAGNISMRLEPDSNALRWARGYDFAAVHDGRIKRAVFTPPRLLGMLGFAINMRRPQFADRRVREALVHAFDFKWVNTNYFFDSYERSRTFFPGSDLGATGPADAAERALLEPYMDEVLPRIMKRGLVFETGGDYYTRVRRRMAQALHLFQEAGYEIRNGTMTKASTGEPFTFEIMIEHPDHQRVALNYADDLKKIGIQVRVRLVDAAQFQTRQRSFDFDMMPFVYVRSLSPGAEQSFRWSSAAADTPGSFNFSGVKSPAVDAMVEHLVESRTREDLVTAARALDRLLLSGSYVVPLYHSKGDRVAWWSELRHPARISLMGYDVDTWWMAPEGRAP